MFLDYIEIGTSDFNTEVEINDNKVGISIDPVKYYIDKLPTKSGCIKIVNGISNFNGEITIYYISVDDIHKYALPYWVRGCNSVNKYHPTVSKLLSCKGIKIEDIIVKYTVPCKTLIRLLTDYYVDGFYLLKIDTEGHDFVILEHFFKNNQDNHMLPHKIIFESNELSKKENICEIIETSRKIGYELMSTNHDTVLKLNLRKIHKTFIFSKAIMKYYIEDYPNNYDVKHLPHENTLESAKDYCRRYKCTGITFQYNRYEVRNGKYLNYNDDKTLISWILF